MTSLKPFISAVLVVFGLAFVPDGTALAQSPLDQAKSAGYLGEQPDGYLGVVSPSAPEAVKALAREINLKRREKYTAIARDNGSTLSAVEQVVGAKLMGRAQSGEYIKSPNGSWVRR